MKSVQHTSLGNAMHYTVAVLAMISSLVLFACSGGTGEKRNISATVPLNSTNIAALEGSFPPQFTIPDGSVFSTGIGNNPVSLTFVVTSGGTSTVFILARFGSTALATGGVTFGSCILTVTSSTFPTGQGPQTGDTITFSTCSIVVSASNVEVGGGTETGTIIFMLTRTITDATTGATTDVSAASTPITLVSSVSIQRDGTLLLNNVNTGINTNVTGTIPR
jgi:hypothetical protein